MEGARADESTKLWRHALVIASFNNYFLSDGQVVLKRILI